MFTGDYGFFDYKYNIPGYEGQDYGGTAQYVYLSVALVIIFAASFALRNIRRENVRKIVGALGIFLTLFYICKTGWESYYDIQKFGSFNLGLLPLDTCSVIMPAAIIAAYGRGRLREAAECWVATGGFVGGFATMLFLNAFKYYPFFSFGAFYSMLWHMLMVFMSFITIISMRPKIKFRTVTAGFAFHCVFMLVAIPVDFALDMDFMLCKKMGGVPFFEDVASSLSEAGLAFLNPLIMAALYFVSFSLVFFVAAALKNRRKHPAVSAE